MPASSRDDIVLRFTRNQPPVKFNLPFSTSVPRPDIGPPDTKTTRPAEAGLRGSRLKGTLGGALRPNQLFQLTLERGFSCFIIEDAPEGW